MLICKCIKINCTIVIMNGIEGIFISYGGKMMDLVIIDSVLMFKSIIKLYGSRN